MRENGVSSIPSSSKKIVQSLKEIVNCPEHEIYAMLKDCNMDPNETVNRLLSQDTFHEVKSKRDKKKEVKDNTEARSRGVTGTSSRSRVGTDRDGGHSSFTKFGSTDSGLTRGKPAYKKDNKANTIPKLSDSSALTDNVTNNSAPVSVENTVFTVDVSDSFFQPPKPSSAYQPAWVGAPGHVSMADIVKMGRPRAKTMSQQNAIHSTSLLSESHHDIHSSKDPALKVSDKIHDQSRALNQTISGNNWPALVQQSPAASAPAVCESPSASVAYNNHSPGLYDDKVNLQSASVMDDVQVTEETLAVQNQEVDSASELDKHIQMDNAGSFSCTDDTAIKNRNSYQSQGSRFEHQEGSSDISIADYSHSSSVQDTIQAVSSAAMGLQHLDLQKEEISAPPTRENRAVIIPDHLQVPTADCSHLSFGSFGSNNNAAFSGSFTSKSVSNNSDGAPGVENVSTANVSSVEQLDSRNTQDYCDEHHISTETENVRLPSPPQSGILKHEIAIEAADGHQYQFPSSSTSYAVGSTTQTNATGYSSQMNSQMQNHSSLLSGMQASANSLSGSFLASAVQPVQESEFPFSPFAVAQSTPIRYNAAIPSTSGLIVSAPEVLKPSALTSPQLNHQTLPSTSIPMTPALAQHLAMHPFSQPALFANMVTYPFLPQSYTYMPSAFQQAYAANSVYHQSPASAQNAGMKYSLPQYKNSVSASSLPQSATVASAYGGIGNSTNIPGSFLLNPSTATPSTTTGYEEVMGSSQYKDTSHYGSTQQNEASTMWVNGPGSRTMSVLPASAYYGFQGQNQQGVIRQNQQSSHYGAPGYANIYHSQVGISQDHQQQRSDGTLNASQGTPQQSHHIWQQTY